MKTSRFSTGAFVFSRPRKVDPRDPHDLKPLLAKHRIEPNVLPAYAGDRVAVTRAIEQAKAGLARNGLLLRPIRRTATEVVFGIIRETKDVVDERLEHEFESTIRWSVEPDPSVISGDHPVAWRVADTYRQLRGKIVAEDWSVTITSFLEAHDAARVRNGVFWVPPQRVEKVRQLGGFLEELGVDLVLCEVVAEARSIVEGVVSESLDAQLERLQTEADSFTGNERPSTFSRRLKEYQRLRERAVLYRAALGVGVDRAQAVLVGLESRVSEMLDLRKATVIHRDSSSSPAVSNATEMAAEGANDDASASLEETTQPANSAAPALRFAGARFELVDDDADVMTFVGGDATAQGKVVLLERMGIAGKFQKLAGSTRVLIKNGGPPGRAVSIGVELPEGQDIYTAARSLSAIGIEVCEGIGGNQ